MRVYMKSFLALALCGLSASSDVPKSWDYFILVRSWEPTTCRLHQCAYDAQSRFTIHGLWPEADDGTWPQYCDNAKFSVSDIPDLLDEMKDVWPSMYGDDFLFWKHEWSRHGTCSHSIFEDPHAFFSAVLDLHRQLDLNAAKAKLHLNEDTKYGQPELEDKLSSLFGKQIRTHCQNSMLSELWMCVDKDLKLRDCPDNIALRCPTIELPSVRQDRLRVLAPRTIFERACDMMIAVCNFGSALCLLVGLYLWKRHIRAAQALEEGPVDWEANLKPQAPSGVSAPLIAEHALPRVSV